MQISAFCAVASMSASAARAPDAVEKKIVITGEAAVSVAELLGLPSSGSSSASLQLGRGYAWAVYLLKQDTKERLWNDNDGSPARYNTVEFTSSPIASLTISPYWLDLATNLPNQKIGSYSFGSDFIAENFEPNEPWTRLLARLKKEPGWKSDAWRQFQRCFISAEKTELCIEVFSAKRYVNNVPVGGYSVAIEFGTAGH